MQIGIFTFFPAGILATKICYSLSTIQYGTACLLFVAERSSQLK